MTFEGGMAAMIGGAGGNPPTLTTRLKGSKGRVDIDFMGNKITTITDIEKKQVILLNEADKTAIVHDTTTAAVPAAVDPAMPVPKIDTTVKATGKSQTIDGVPCDEHVFTITIGMGELTGGGQTKPEPGSPAEMMKDVKLVMNGSSWVAKGGPGAEEVMAFQKTATAQGLDWVLRGGLPGQQVQGMDKLLAAFSATPGVAYLTEINMTFEGTGPMVDMMKQMGAMKLTQKVTSIKTDTIADDVFIVPADYKVEKK